MITTEFIVIYLWSFVAALQIGVWCMYLIMKTFKNRTEAIWWLASCLIPIFPGIVMLIIELKNYNQED